MNTAFAASAVQAAAMHGTMTGCMPLPVAAAFASMHSERKALLRNANMQTQQQVARAHATGMKRGCGMVLTMRRSGAGEAGG